MLKIFETTRSLLGTLDDTRITIITFNPNTQMLTMRQLGGKTINLSHLVGYLIPIKHTCLLTPVDLVELKNIFEYLSESKEQHLVIPVKNGYDLYCRGDILYTSKPRLEYKIRISSITNRFVIWLARIQSEEIQALFRLIRGLKIKK